MNVFKRRTFSPLWAYTISGVLFGLLFPIASSINEIKFQGIPVSVSSFFQVQKSNPLLWVIDTAPLFLGIFAYVAGAWKQKLEDQSSHLEDLVESGSKEVLREKLFYEALVHNNPLAIVTLDKGHRIISINPAFTEMFGYRQDEIVEKEIDPLIANPECLNEAAGITRGVLNGKPMHEFGKRQRKDGTLIDVEIFGQPIMVNSHQTGALGLYRNITLEKRAQDALAASKERFRRMFMDSPIALRMEDFSAVKEWMDKKAKSIKGDLRDYLQQHPKSLTKILPLAKIVDLNEASLLMFRAKNMEELQERLHSILSCESSQDAIDVLCQLLDGNTILERELVYERLDGKKIFSITKLSVVPGYEKTWGRILFSNMDISERKMAEERLTYISLHDTLTTVYNRAFFDEEMARFEKSRTRPISILVMDMDNFKIINDQLGHQIGDIALQIIANTLQASFRAEDIIARIGGDEFAVLLPGVNAEMTEKVRSRVMAGIAESNRQDNYDLQLSVSIGCATVEKGDSMDEAFKRADKRMYLEKQAKRNSGNSK